MAERLSPSLNLGGICADGRVRSVLASLGNTDTQTAYVEVASNAFDSLAIRGRAAAVQPRQRAWSPHRAIQTAHEVLLHALDGVGVHVGRHGGPAMTDALGYSQQVPTVCQEHGDVAVAERVEFDTR